MKFARTLHVALLMTAASLAFIDRTRAADPSPPATQPVDVQITFNTTEAPELKDWAENTLKPVLVKWYPKVVAELPITDHAPPAKFDIKFTNSYKGVAATSGTHVVANTDWITQNLKGESVGALLHEMVHVVQQPYHTMHHGATYMPTWLLEGTCDYIRWFQYEPNHPNPRGNKPHYDDAYRTSATFLKYVVDNYDKHFLAEVNEANYFGKYTPDLWKQHTGKTEQELGSEWEKSIGGTGEPHKPATRPARTRRPTTSTASTKPADH